MSSASALSKVGKSSIEEAILQIRSGELETWDAREILTYAVENFHPRLALSASFGAPEGMVLLDLMHQIEPTSRVFVLDTGRLPQATYDLIDRVRDRYGKPVEMLFPRFEDVEKITQAHGANLFYESIEKRKLCCQIRKVEPMRRYLAGLDAYVTGLRRDQNVTRTHTPKALIDESYGGVVKLNPIAGWSQDEVWDYVREHQIPVNRLHKSGYPSVGCDPCSRAIRPGEDIRAGRWWWESQDTKECGLHGQEQEHGSGI
jgi:phosphoadenosine phosphosulfate reductase